MPSSSCGVSRTSASTQVARGAGRRGQAPREVQHPRAEVDAHDLVRAEVPQRQRVAAAGALEVDRPAAPPAQVADQVLLDREEVRAARRGSARPPRRTSPRSARRPRPRPRGSRRACRGRRRPPRAWRPDVGIGRHGRRVYAGNRKGRRSLGRRPIDVISAGGRAQSPAPIGRAVAGSGPDRRRSRRGRRSRGSPPEGGSPGCRRRAMRRRLRSTGAVIRRAVAGWP